MGGGIWNRGEIAIIGGYGNFYANALTAIVFHQTQFLGSYNFSLKSIKIIPINIAIDEDVEKFLNLLKYEVF